jgi:carboxylesterase type B
VKGFTNGDTNTPFYNGRYFSEAEDVVVVTVNYRIGIFGFPGAPGQAQNLGLRDQRMAVEWLHDNVKVFGGDPKKITILGQSSGALSVDAWTYAYRQNPIANGIIAMSGTIFSFPLNTQELSTRHWYNASSIVGCGSSGDVMACMRGKTAAELKAAAAAIPPAPGTSPARAQPIFQPTPDGEIIFDHYEQLTSLGRFARVVCSQLLSLLPNYDPTTKPSPFSGRYLLTAWHPQPLLVGHTDTEQSFYNISAWSRGNFLTQEEWEQFNLDVFNCPTKRSAAGRVAYDVPTWRYRYYADWENTGIFPTSGAYHGVDLHMIFGNSQGVTGIAESAPQTLLKKTMQKAWATFAADPVDGLTALGWPRYKTGPPGEYVITEVRSLHQLLNMC